MHTFDEEKMYTYLEKYATVNNLTQTLAVLPYAKEMHKNQFRKGKDKVPYIHHPLLVACHALALGLEDDDLISTALLHDVCEDCGIAVEDLPVNATTKEAVGLLTKTSNNYGKTDKEKEPYYSAIAKNPIATMVKLIDRCNNISGMAAAFSKEKMMRYIKETQDWFYPMMQQASKDFPMYSNQIFLIQYHMTSVIETIENQL